jgi:hypothetical protein
MDADSSVSADLVLVAPVRAPARRLPAASCDTGRAAAGRAGPFVQERTGPPPGWPVRSIRKNNVLPGSGPTDLHYGKNGYVLPGSGPTDLHVERLRFVHPGRAKN